MGVFERVEDLTGVGEGRIMQPTRGSPDEAWARAVAMWMFWQLWRNKSEVGRHFSRDRTTVRHAIQRVEAELPPLKRQHLMGGLH